MAEDKSKQLNETLSQIEKQFGKGTVMRMGDSCLLYTSPSPRD